MTDLLGLVRLVHLDVNLDVFCLLIAGSLWHKDRWLPCTERSYYFGVFCLLTAGSLWHKGAP